MEYKLLAEIADHIPGIIFAKTSEGKFIFVNREYERLFGVTREWLIGKTCHDFMPGDIADICCGHDKTVLTEGVPQKFDEEYLVKGERRTYSSLKFPLRDESGAVNGVAGISTDITERKSSEEALKATNAKLEALINAIPDQVVFKDAEGRHQVVNRAAEKFLGCTAAELLGKVNEEVMPADLAAVCRASDERAIMNPLPTRYEETMAGQAGETVYLDTIKASLRDHQGNLLGLVMVSRDITERKQTEQQMKLFLDLINRSNDGILVIDLGTGGISLVNDKLCRDLQYSREELLAMRPEDISTMPPGFFSRHFRELRQVGTFLAEDHHRRKDGTTFPVEVNVKYIRLNEQEFAVAVIRDISERKRLEQELQKTQRLESIGHLAGGIAHDFNNILTAILGNIELARMFLPPEEQVSRRLAIAEESAVRAREITQQLLTFAKGGAPIKKAALVPPFIRNSVEFALRGANVKSTFAFQPDLSLIDVDENQMRQVINNLVLNACQAMPEGGFLTVCATNEAVLPGNSLDLAEGRYVRIDLTDQGAGIPEEHLGLIFDPYFTTKESGSGLGLAISYSIVKRHGGTITVRSTPGKGSSFSIFLPASAEKEVERETLEPQETSGGCGRILVMDDEAAVNEIAADMLQHLGYRVETVPDGAAAVAAYQAALQANDPFDAVIADLTVPGGMGGRETARRLSELDPQARVIVSSGYANDPIMSDYPRHGFKGVIPKPYRLDELGKTLKEVLGGKKG